jgi:hypothetical protein
LVTGLPVYFELAPIYDGLLNKGNGLHSDDALVIPMLVIFALLFGLPLGHSIAQKGKQSYLVYGPDTWGRAVLRCLGVQLLSLIAALTTSFSLASRDNYDSNGLLQVGYFIAPFIALPVFWWIISKTVHWLCVARANTQGKPGFRFILYVCAHTFWMGFSLALPALILGWESSWLIYVWAGLFGFLQIVCSITLACGQSMVGGEASYNELSRLRIRSRLKTAAIISVILWFVIYFHFRRHTH